MQLTLRVVLTVVVLITAALGVLVIFDVVSTDVFRDNMVKVIGAAIVITGGTLAVIGLQQGNKNNTQKK